MRKKRSNSRVIQSEDPVREVSLSPEEERQFQLEIARFALEDPSAPAWLTRHHQLTPQAELDYLRDRDAREQAKKRVRPVDIKKFVAEGGKSYPDFAARFKRPPTGKEGEAIAKKLKIRLFEFLYPKDQTRKSLEKMPLAKLRQLNVLPDGYHIIARGFKRRADAELWALQRRLEPIRVWPTVGEFEDYKWNKKGRVTNAKRDKSGKLVPDKPLEDGEWKIIVTSIEDPTGRYDQYIGDGRARRTKDPDRRRHRRVAPFEEDDLSDR